MFLWFTAESVCRFRFCVLWRKWGNTFFQAQPCTQKCSKCWHTVDAEGAGNEPKTSHVELLEKQHESPTSFCYNLYAWMQDTWVSVQKLINITPKCVSSVQLLDCGQLMQVTVKFMGLEMKCTHMAAGLRWQCFTAPALTSCQYQHFSDCNSFTVIILGLARKNAPKTLKT